MLLRRMPGRYIPSILCGMAVMMALWSLAEFAAFALDPAKMKYQSLLNAGEQADISHDYHAAELHYRLAATEAEKFGPLSREVEESQARLASSYVLQGKLDLAEPHYQRAKSIATEVSVTGKGDPETLVWLDDLSDSYQLKAQSMQPEFCYHHCLDLRRAISFKNQKIPQIEYELGNYLFTSGRKDDALPYLKHALKMFKAHDGALSISAGNADLSIASVYMDQEKFSLADQYCLAAIDTFAKRMGPDHFTVGNVKRLHGVLLRRMHKLPEAETVTKEAIAIHEKQHPTDPCELGGDYSGLASVYLDKGDLVHAEQAARRALDLQHQGKAATLSNRIATMHLMASILKRNHHTAEAAKLETQIKALETQKH